MMERVPAIIALYLGAIVSANVIVGHFGPSVSVLTAFAFVGLVMTTRDRLHDAWGRHLGRNMALLIATGAALSLLFGGGVSRIALASAAAFFVSEAVDALAYHALRDRGWYTRANGSNTVAAAVDSLLFPALAFGVFLPLIVLGQFLAKTFGGAVWSWIVRPRNAVLAALVLFAAPVSGQSVSVGLGGFHNDFGQQTVGEVVVLAPASWVTPNLIASWDISGGGRPVVIPQVGRDVVVRFPVILGVDVGASAGPWDDYAKWEPHVSARALAFVSGPLKVVSIMSWQPWNDWARSAVLKADITVW